MATQIANAAEVAQRQTNEIRGTVPASSLCRVTTTTKSTTGEKTTPEEDIKDVAEYQLAPAAVPVIGEDDDDVVFVGEYQLEPSVVIPPPPLPSLSSPEPSTSHVPPPSLSASIPSTSHAVVVPMPPSQASTSNRMVSPTLMELTSPADWYRVSTHDVGVQVPEPVAETVAEPAVEPVVVVEPVAEPTVEVNLLDMDDDFMIYAAGLPELDGVSTTMTTQPAAPPTAPPAAGGS